MEKFISDLEANPERLLITIFLSEEELTYYVEFCLSKKVNLPRIYAHALNNGEVSILKRLPDDFEFFNPVLTRAISGFLCRGFVDVFDFLLEKGLDVNMDIKRGASTLLSVVLSTINTPGCLDIAIKLIDNGASIITGTKRTKHIVKSLVDGGSVEIFDRLILAGLDLHYYQHQMWKRRILYTFVPEKETGIAERLYNMGFPIPLPIAEKCIEKIVTQYNKAHNSEEGIATQTNQLFMKLDKLWKLYGEDKEITLKFPYIQDSSDEDDDYYSSDDSEDYCNDCPD